MKKTDLSLTQSIFQLLKGWYKNQENMKLGNQLNHKKGNIIKAGLFTSCMPLSAPKTTA